MGKPTDVRVEAVRLYLLPIHTRMPLKFGPETVTQVTCARVCLTVRDRQGRTAQGWGETPLSVQWVWPSVSPYEVRLEALQQFCLRLARAWSSFDAAGHALEVGHDFQAGVLPRLHDAFNRDRPGTEPMPWLAALVCCSVFDQGLHDAFGRCVGRPVYETYRAEFMNRDLAAFLEPAPGAAVDFRNRYPSGFLLSERRDSLLAWHLVGGVDPLEPRDLTDTEPDDGYPVLLEDWIRRDGLRCLKVKLRGNDAAWDGERLIKVGRIGARQGVEWFSADFNCTVTDPAYVAGVLDRVRDEAAELWQRLLYIEQPFPYDLERHPIDVRDLARRKPLFLDESAHDWRAIRRGRELGWNGVALKTCKTQTGALLSACWAQAHGLRLMVQDLTNPMLAQIPHLLLAAHLPTIMGVETNSMQFYPEASGPEALVHPGLYARREGRVDLSTVRGAGFGYRQEEIERRLPPEAGHFSAD